MKKYKIAIGISLILIMVFLWTGCTKEKNPNMDEGMKAIESLQYETALECFEKAEENGENPRLIARGKGIAFLGLTDYQNAATCLEEALKLSNGLVEEFDYDVNYYLATAYIKSNQLGKAEGVYNAIIGMRAEDVDSHFLRGFVRLGLTNLEGAKEDFDKVIALSPKDYDRVIQIYEALSQYGYEEIGKGYLKTALDNASEMNDYDKGRIHFYLGNYEEAYLCLEEAKRSGKADAYLYLGRAYEATGDYNYASTVYNHYLEKDTLDARIYNQLGLCEMKKGEYEKALVAFQSGMKIEGNPIMQTLQFNEIVAYEYLKDFKQAEVLMDHYLKNYPDDEEAKREYEFLLTR